MHYIIRVVSKFRILVSYMHLVSLAILLHMVTCKSCISNILSLLTIVSHQQFANNTVLRNLKALHMRTQWHV
jgi:hypothetical protein